LLCMSCVQVAPVKFLLCMSCAKKIFSCAIGILKSYS
jgi:hypothetical protein